MGRGAVIWWTGQNLDQSITGPDGSTWFLSALVQLRGGKVYRETWYFAPPFDAPAWRAEWVERIS